MAYPNPSYAQLRQRLLQHHQLECSEDVSKLSSDWILPGNGAAELLTWAGRELANCDRTYLVSPAFSDYERAIAAFGGKVTELPLSLRALTDSPSIRFPALGPHNGILINNPHNPTGYLFAADQLRPLVESGALVVVDEAFMDFLPPEEQQSVIGWLPQFSNLVVVRSLTKFYSLAGLRLGYALLHPERAARWQQWRDPWPVNALATAAAEAALGDRDFQRRTWRWLAQARQQLCAGLNALTALTVYPGAANFLLVRSDRSCTELQTILLRQHRIFIRDCMSFPALGDRFFRVAVRTEAENQRLLTALASVLQPS